MKYALLFLVTWAALIAIGLVVWKQLRGPSTVEREAVGDALGADICRHGVCPRECPSCRPMPPAIPTTPGRVSADEIQFFASLARMEDELEAITEGGYRLPGERAS